MQVNAWEVRIAREGSQETRKQGNVYTKHGFDAVYEQLLTLYTDTPRIHPCHDHLRKSSLPLFSSDSHQLTAFSYLFRSSQAFLLCLLIVSPKIPNLEIRPGH